MAKKEDLLLEIGTEELPPRELVTLGAAWGAGLSAALVDARLVTADTAVRTFAAPRRITAHITAITARQEAQTVVRKGPALAAAFEKDGSPTKAALGFARSLGVEVASLETLHTERGAFLGYHERQAGRTLTEVLGAVLPGVLSALPAGRRMRWGAGEAEFVRPVHWIVALHGRRVLRLPLFGLVSGRRSRGHRFHAPRPLSIPAADAYEKVLEEQGRVVADFGKRRDRIRDQIEHLARTANAQAIVEPELLDLVTALVEWPHAVLGRFDEQFLAVPREALIAAMQGHQKYFPLERDGRLLPHFITIANIAPENDQTIRKGNERVLAARFADARFFWDSDRKKPLETYAQELSQVAFEKRLGSLADKASRLERLARTIGAGLALDGAQAGRAAALCKADLLTDMVGEFPELQGVMGGHYAHCHGEAPAIAQAIAEHYRPRFSGDALPASQLGLVLALTDKLDTLVGIFGIGLAPTGDKDPFALRRAAIGILRLLEALGQHHDLEIAPLLEQARAQYPEGLLAPTVTDEVRHFLAERLRNLLENRFSQDVVAAALSPGLARVLDTVRRAQALAGFAQSTYAASLVGAHKRIRNILRQNREPLDAQTPWPGVEAADKRLVQEVERCERAAGERAQAGDYQGSLESLRDLRPAVDAFFEDVLVMSDDMETRKGRLRLLTRLATLLEAVGDLSCLKIAGEPQ